MVEGAALEMLCPERDLGFESLTLRQNTCLYGRCFHFIINNINNYCVFYINFCEFLCVDFIYKI